MLLTRGRMAHGSLLAVAGLTALWLGISTAQAEQFVLFDTTFTFTKEDADNSKPSPSHYYVRDKLMNAERPRDWTSPVDYRNGTAHVRLEVLEKPPGSEATTWSVCYIPNKGQKNGYGCFNTPVYKEAGVYEQDIPMTKFWQNDSIVWDQGIKEMHLVIKDNSGGSGHAHKRTDHEKFFPTKIRMSVIQVSAGSKYDASLVPDLPPAKTESVSPETNENPRQPAAQDAPNPVDSETPLPGGWQLNARPSERHYRIGLDRQVFHGGKSAGLLESQEAEFQKNHYASMVQSLDVRSHRGKRLRLSAFLKTQDVRESAYLKVNIPHLYADSADSFWLKPPIQGSTDWKRYEVEFTVTDMEGTAQIECGVYLIGPGRVWIDDVSLEFVGYLENIRTPPANSQDPQPPPLLFDEFANANFEQTQLEYDLGLLQGEWEIKYSTRGKTKIIEITREVLQVNGNKITFTDYNQNQDRNEQVWQQHTQDFDLERSGRISLITRRDIEVTKGMAKGSRSPAGSASSNPYTVNRSQFVEVFNLMDGAKGPPILTQWNRVAK